MSPRWLRQFPLPLPRSAGYSTYIGLMALSVLMLLIPPGSKSWLRGVLQPIAWLESIGSVLARGVRATTTGWVAADAQDPVRLREERDQFEREIVSQDMRIIELERQLGEVTALRERLRDEQALIIPAPVAGGSAAPGRESLTVRRGSSHGAAQGDWVAAGRAEDRRDPSATGRELLTREWIIGRISSVQPFVSEVQLCTDPAFGPVPVVAARRLADGRWQRAERRELLRGIGYGRMRVPSATTNYRDEKFTHVLIEIPTATPAFLVAGLLDEARALSTSALHFDIDVQPVADARQLSFVYIISLPK